MEVESEGPEIHTRGKRPFQLRDWIPKEIEDHTKPTYYCFMREKYEIFYSPDFLNEKLRTLNLDQSEAIFKNYTLQGLPLSYPCVVIQCGSLLMFHGGGLNFILKIFHTWALFVFSPSPVD